jgi:hypothetical protein
MLLKVFLESRWLAVETFEKHSQSRRLPYRNPSRIRPQIHTMEWLQAVLPGGKQGFYKARVLPCVIK